MKYFLKFFRIPNSKVDLLKFYLKEGEGLPCIKRGKQRHVTGTTQQPNKRHVGCEIQFVVAKILALVCIFMLCIANQTFTLHMPWLPF